MTRTLLAAVTATTLLFAGGTTPVQAAGPSPKIAKLKRKLERAQDSRDKWRDRARTYQRERNRAQDAIADLQDRLSEAQARAALVAGLEADKTTLQAANGALAADNAALRSGLPNAVRAVPVSEMVRLVLDPARAVWPCDSYYTSGGYWSITFDSLSFCP